MINIHPAAACGFERSASSYVTGRPDYPFEAIGWLRDDLHLAPGKAVLDLGAGTGKFIPSLAATGASIIAVEPVAAMRSELLGQHPGITVRGGTAQTIPLEAEAVDAVTCAQAFHWFATPQALAEIRRVLRPKGILGLIWNKRDESVKWVAALSDVMRPYEGDAPRHHKLEWQKVFPAEGFGSLAERRFPHRHVGVPQEVIVERILSVSFIAALPADEQAKVAAQIWDVINTTEELAGKSEVAFPYETVAYSAVKLG
ncbi:MAG TPA: class I SAM-dependent methyltransferase [Methylocella sp.]|nr:class I SAM-dependent methyltransferase [Methylocella sp.]